MNHQIDGEAVPLYNALGCVRYCSCGGAQLSFGAVSLHFAQDELELLAQLVDSARRKELVRASSSQTTQLLDSEASSGSSMVVAVKEPKVITVRGGRRRILHTYH